MKNPTQQQIDAANSKFLASVKISTKIIEFLEQEGIDMDLAVLAMGVAYAGGAKTIGMPLPAAIDLVRGTYNMGSHETH
jgi:hypothetical protein